MTQGEDRRIQNFLPYNLHPAFFFIDSNYVVMFWNRNKRPKTMKKKQNKNLSLVPWGTEDMCIQVYCIIIFRLKIHASFLLLVFHKGGSIYLPLNLSLMSWQCFFDLKLISSGFYIQLSVSLVHLVFVIILKKKLYSSLKIFLFHEGHIHAHP